MADNQDRQNALVQRYGAYGVGFLGAVGALVAALLMPASATTLIGGAGTIAVLTFFFTSENDRFGVRLIAMLGAGVALLFAYLMPGNAPQLISGAGMLAALALIFA